MYLAIARSGFVKTSDTQTLDSMVVIDVDFRRDFGVDAPNFTYSSIPRLIAASLLSGTAWWATLSPRSQQGQAAFSRFVFFMTFLTYPYLLSVVDYILTVICCLLILMIPLNFYWWIVRIKERRQFKRKNQAGQFEMEPMWKWFGDDNYDFKVPHTAQPKHSLARVPDEKNMGQSQSQRYDPDADGLDWIIRDLATISLGQHRRDCCAVLKEGDTEPEGNFMMRRFRWSWRSFFRHTYHGGTPDQKGDTLGSKVLGNGHHQLFEMKGHYIQRESLLPTGVFLECLLIALPF